MIACRCCFHGRTTACWKVSWPTEVHRKPLANCTRAWARSICCLPLLKGRQALVAQLTFCAMDRLQLAACARSLQHFLSASSTVLATRAVRKVSWPIGVQLQPLATCSHAWARSVNCRHCSDVVKSSSLIDALDYGYCICFFKRCLQLAARARSLQHFAMQCSSILCRFYRYNLSFVSSSTTLAFLSRSR